MVKKSVDTGVIPAEPDINLSEFGFDFIEEGIRELVKVLWEFDYKTIYSCAGHLNDSKPYPWVVILTDIANSQSKRDKLLLAIGRYNISLGENGNFPESLKMWTLAPILVHNGLALFLMPADRNTSRSTEKITELRNSAKKLAEFLEINLE